MVFLNMFFDVSIKVKGQILVSTILLLLFL